MIGYLTFSLIEKIEIRNSKNETLQNYSVPYAFNVPLETMEQTFKSVVEVDPIINDDEDCENLFVNLISLLASKYYGDWSEFNQIDLDIFTNELKKGTSLNQLTQPYKNYDEFKKMFNLLFGEIVSPFKISKKFNSQGEPIFEDKFGVKFYFPIPYEFDVSFCDDFEDENQMLSSTSHLGIDISSKLKTPIVAVESGEVLECGKTDDLGWQLKIKSFDGNRIYYYSNCFDKKPFSNLIKPKATIKAGQVIGYVGANSCCAQKIVRAKNCPHLHFAVSLNSDKNDSKKIWINPYNLLKFLQHHKSVVLKNEETGEFENKYLFVDPDFEKYKNSSN